jgi:hypothetical protein
MSDNSRSEAQVAFIAAAVVLLALPLLVAFGLAVIALATRAGTSGETDWIVWMLFVVWVVLVVAAVLVFAVRFIRRSA